MQNGLKISSGQASDLARRMSTLLRERIGNRSHKELLAYIDQLLPLYTASAVAGSGNRDGRTSYHWSEFLQFYDENFLRFVYVTIFRREPDSSGMQSGLQALRIEKCSRIELLGRLRFSGEGRRHAVEIKGLWLRYQMARFQRIPVLGAAVGVVANLGYLSRPDVKYDAVNTAIELQKKSVALAEKSIAATIDSVASNLDGTSRAVESASAEDVRQKAEHTDIRPTLKQVLDYKGSKYVTAVYDIVHARVPTELELHTALSRLLQGRESKVSMLGKLCESPGAKLRKSDIEGLAAAYARERVYGFPVIGFVLQLPKAVRFLSRADTIMEFQQREIAECESQLAQLELRLMGHYNDTVKHLKLKFVELVQSESRE